jgi:hypothetical protein
VEYKVVISAFGTVHTETVEASSEEVAAGMVSANAGVSITVTPVEDSSEDESS